LSIVVGLFNLVCGVCFFYEHACTSHACFFVALQEEHLGLEHDPGAEDLGAAEKDDRAALFPNLHLDGWVTDVLLKVSSATFQQMIAYADSSWVLSSRAYQGTLQLTTDFNTCALQHICLFFFISVRTGYVCGSESRV
jgi:hypothetical protein